MDLYYQLLKQKKPYPQIEIHTSLVLFNHIFLCLLVKNKTFQGVVSH